MSLSYIFNTVKSQNRSEVTILKVFTTRHNRTILLSMLTNVTVSKHTQIQEGFKQENWAGGLKKSLSLKIASVYLLGVQWFPEAQDLREFLRESTNWF